jgi:hypothetical protein
LEERVSNLARNKKRKKLDILYRKLKKRMDPHNTYDILSEIRIKDKIRVALGKKRQFPSLPSAFKGR